MIFNQNNLKVGLKPLESYYESGFFFFWRIIAFNILITVLLLFVVIDSDADSSLIGLLIECALQLTMDGDKVIVVDWFVFCPLVGWYGEAGGTHH